MLKQQYVDALEGKLAHFRLKALKNIRKKFLSVPKKRSERESVNMQIHTKCSFSPYTPSLAAYMASKFGLRVAGIMDNYTLSGAREFIKACNILGITYSVGVEIRTDFAFGDAKSSNVAICGIAKRHINAFENELRPLRQNQRQNSLNSLEAVNRKLKKHDISIDFAKDVLHKMPRTRDKVYLSKFVYQALGVKLIEKFKKGAKIADFLKEALGMGLTTADVGLLSDCKNPYYLYDLTNIIFENCNVFFAKKSYTKPETTIALAHKYGAVCVYELALKDRIEHENEKATTDILALIDKLKTMGFDGMAFDANKLCTPIRDAVLKKLKACEMLTLTMSRIEFPRRKFDVSFPDVATEKAVSDSCYAIVGSEMCENQTCDGMLRNTKLSINGFEEKIALFAKIGRKGC